MDPRRKIMGLEQTDAWVAAAKAAGHRVGFTCGAFDLLHAGHAHYLAAAKSLCHRLIVAVNSDESVRRYKNPLRPIVPEDQRMYLVAALESVDAVTRMDDDRPLRLLLRWKPDLYIKGSGYSEDSLGSAESVRGYGGEVRLIRPEFGTSTSATLERIAALVPHAGPEPAPTPPARRLALVDRDGTLIRDMPFLHDPAQVELLPGAVEGLLALQDAGFRLCIVTNQQGIGLGYFTPQELIAVNQRLLAELGARGVRISRIYFCPHSLADSCDCRKPASGMIARAMRDFGVAPEQTVILGDSAADQAAAAAAGCRFEPAGEAGFAAAARRAIAAVP